MGDIANNKLPMRQMEDDDGIAIKVFQGVMRNIERDNDGDPTKCWEWPQDWPPHWEPLPKGFSASINGNGRGQFVLTLMPGVMRQASPEAHQLSYQYFNLLLDPSLTLVGFEGSTWLGKDYLKASEIIETTDGIVKVMRRVVRHSPGCTSKACVNPFHLSIGTDWQNMQLDEALKKGIVELNEAAIANADNVINDIRGGELDARVLATRYKLKAIDIVNIAKAAGLSWQSLLNDFNPHGHVDHKPKP